MLRTNLSASSPTSSEKTISNQGVENPSYSQTNLISPRSSGRPTGRTEQSASPLMRSHDSILHRSSVLGSTPAQDDSGSALALSGRLSSSAKEGEMAEKRKNLFGSLNFSFRTPEKSLKSKSGHASPTASPRSPRTLAWAEEVSVPASPRSPRKSEADPLRVDRHRILSNSPRSPRASLNFQVSQKAADAMDSPSHSMAHRMSAPPVLIRMPITGLNAGRQTELAKSVALAWLDTAKADASKPKKSTQQKSPTDPSLSPRTTAVPVLSDSVCNAFARTEYKIPKSALPADLLALLPSDAQEHISHTALIKVLFTPKFKESPAGKTILAMKAAVMQQHSADGLKLGIPDTEERKKSATAAMKTNAEAIADVCFGAGTRGLSGSQLPKELIEFWKMVDAALVAWALENPDLSADKINSVRSNLGIDIILTRQIYPMIFGHKEEADLAVPGWFGNVVREAAIKVWPAFFNDFVKSANLALAAPLQAALAERATSKTSSDVQAQKILSEKSDKAE